jgi:hypothetical protein
LVRKKGLNWQYGICYLCGIEATMTPEKKLTKDHVPPECFAPEPLASFTATSTSRFHYAWACKACNNSYSDLEKAFKNFMLAGAEDRIQAADDAWNKVISENNKSKEKYGIPSKTMRELTDKLVFEQSHTTTSTDVPPSPFIQIARDTEELNVAIKIARGLHVIHTGEIIPSTYEMGLVFNKQIGNFDQIPPTYSRFDTDFFQYFGYVKPEDPKIGIWYMLFYKNVLAVVGFRPTKQDE